MNILHLSIIELCFSIIKFSHNKKLLILQIFSLQTFSRQFKNYIRQKLSLSVYFSLFPHEV